VNDVANFNFNKMIVWNEKHVRTKKYILRTIDDHSNAGYNFI